jgi:uncharacterized phage protein (TIGR02216 family)
MQFGFGILRLSPDEFWAMTPRELGTAFNAIHPGGTRTFDRQTMEELMKKFPDMEMQCG